MRQGEFSAFINLGTGSISLVKTPNEFEYQNSTLYSQLCFQQPKRDVMETIQQYFEDNYVPEENRNIIH